MTRILVKRPDIAKQVRWIRGERILLDTDLAALYSVATRTLIQAVKRNRNRFPADFIFQLSATEVSVLRSQSVISNQRGGRRYRPYAFTEQGIAMLSSVLRSKTAVAVNIEIMRTFVRLREALATHSVLAKKIMLLEQKYDTQFKVVFDAIRALMTPPPKARRKIGF